MRNQAALQQTSLPDGWEKQGLIIDEHFLSYYQVESALYCFPKVLEAGVIVKYQKGEKEILKVYLALEDSFSDEEEQARYCLEVEDFIRKEFYIPIPVRVLVRDKLPLTRSGKILRSVLCDY